MTKLGSRGGGKAAKRSSSWFTSSSLGSSSLTSSISVSEISSSVKTGGFHIHGDLAKFKDEEVTLVRVRHYSEPIVNNIFGFRHHFGMLEVCLPAPRDLTNILISFEKDKLKDVEKPSKEGTEELKPGGRISVEYLDLERMDLNTEMLLEINLKSCQKIRMQDVFDLLTTEHTPSYTLWTNNCWKYVYDCLKKMLCAFAQLAGTSPGCKESLEEVRQNLRPPALISDVFNWEMIALNLGISVWLGSHVGPAVVTTVNIVQCVFVLLKSVWMPVRGLGSPLLVISRGSPMKMIKLALINAAKIPGLGFLNIGLRGFFVLGLKAAAITSAAFVLGIFVCWLVDVAIKNRGGEEVTPVPQREP